MFPLPLASFPCQSQAKGGCLPARSRFGEGRGGILQEDLQPTKSMLIYYFSVFRSIHFLLQALLNWKK